jgi:hypothetical protein
LCCYVDSLPNFDNWQEQKTSIYTVCTFLLRKLSEVSADFIDKDEQDSEINESFLAPILPLLEKIKRPLKVCIERILSNEALIQSPVVKKFLLKFLNFFLKDVLVLMKELNEMRYTFKGYRKEFQAAMDRIPPKGDYFQLEHST